MSPIPDIGICTEPYEEGRESLLSLRNANRDVPRDEAYLSWRYTSRPASLKPIIVFAVDRTGRKIGCLSVIPHDYAVCGTIHPVGMLGDISVEKNWRGQGVAESMMAHLLTLPEFQQLEAGVVLPNESATGPLRRAGWQSILKLRRYVKILDVEAAWRRQFGSTWLANRLAVLTGHLMRFCSGDHLVTESPAYTSDVVDSSDSRVDDLWERIDKHEAIIGVRNRQYLTWRYATHPTERYRMFILSKYSQPCGYVVFRMNEGRCVIDDWLSVDGRSGYARLLSHFVTHLKRHLEAASVSIMINESHEVATVLKRLGFIKRPDHLLFMIQSHRTRVKPDALMTPAAWFLTAGDKDV